jgi:cysteinyl-tRNA synthetase
MSTTDHPLTLYNSLTREKERFIPQNAKRVTMYNCGPTVYSYAHIGNARAAVVADVLFRVLRHIYGKDHVVYARNITDVDDKIIAAAKAQGVDISVITEKYARIYNEDLAAIGCLEPTHQPLATENIGGMIDMISDLLDKGFAYASDGHVFFDVSKYGDYGKLSGNTLDALRGGDRVGEGEVARKKNAADFVLWKPELGGVGWDAPFGPKGSNMRGRPGWHIECSAMAKETLTKGTGRETIDIHCGGVDLKFPHHENEIAQSNCAHDQPMANYWVHNEFLNMGDTKMSKSLGNVKLIRDLLKDWDGEVIRLALLKAHYRSELTWTEDLLKESKEQLDGWYRSISRYRSSSLIYSDYALPIYAAKRLFDDLNTPEYFSEVSVLRTEVNDFLDYIGREHEFQFSVTPEDGSGLPLLNPNVPVYVGGTEDERKQKVHQAITQKVGKFLAYANLLGLLQHAPEEWFSGGISEADHALAAEYDRVRAEAMAAKQAGDKAAMGAAFSASDAIRETLKAKDLILETGADGRSKLRKA